MAIENIVCILDPRYCLLMAKYSLFKYLWTRSFNSDSQQSHQCRPNERITSHLKSLSTTKVHNSGFGFEQDQKWNGVKPVIDYTSI